MHLNPTTDARPEAMADVPGICELPLTRAIVQYRDVHEMDTGGGRIEDIGMGLVLDGRFASTAEAIDLGSGRVKVLDLSTELVVLDWAYDPTVEHVSELVTASASTRDGEPLRRYTFQLGLRVLERIGFGPLTRPSFLRIGYRDLCRDLDLHEGTSIRVVLGPGRVTRAVLDYDLCALVFRTAFREPDVPLEHGLAEAFPAADLRRLEPTSATDSVEYQVRFPLPATLAETRGALARMRRGMASLVARFEPDRFASLERVLETFGARETLAGLHIHEPLLEAVRVPPPIAGSHVVH